MAYKPFGTNKLDGDIMSSKKTKDLFFDYCKSKVPFSNYLLQDYYENIWNNEWLERTFYLAINKPTSLFLIFTRNTWVKSSYTNTLCKEKL